MEQISQIIVLKSGVLSVIFKQSVLLNAIYKMLDDLPSRLICDFACAFEYLDEKLVCHRKLVGN